MCSENAWTKSDKQKANRDSLKHRVNSFCNTYAEENLIFNKKSHTLVGF